jgi:hypothetical protein
MRDLDVVYGVNASRTAGTIAFDGGLSAGGSSYFSLSKR